MLLFIFMLLSFSLTVSTHNTTLCSLCSNRGSCSNLTCLCLPNWSGPTCDNFTNPCHNDTLCAHDANCTATNVPFLLYNSTNSMLVEANSTRYNSTRNDTQRLHNLHWNATHQCNCSSNYTGKSCEFEICDSSHCYDHGQCIHHPLTNLTRCMCSPSYSGDNCEHCVQCPGDTSLPCSTISCTHGYCEVTRHNHTCHCSIGFQGSYCELDIDECAGHPSLCNNGRCINNIGSYHCNCADTGFGGKNCEEEIFECDYSPCQNGAACSEVSGAGYHCSCTSGWSGLTCAVHDCQRTGICVHGTCSTNPAPFKCHCHPGYEGVHCSQNINECLGVTCQNGGVCQDRLNEYICDCEQGYTGTHCEDRIDYCASRPCVHGQCTSELTGFLCDCNQGFAGNVCDENINDCDPNPCLNGACTDGENTYTCQCSSGYNGLTCDLNIDDCVGNPCGTHGACSDLLNDFTCTCNMGYTGQLCETSINYCSQINCSDHGNCTPSNCTLNPCTNYTDFFHCSCHAGYAGPLCEVDIDYCEHNSCSHGECVEQGVGYRCRCNEGFSGHLCTVNESSCVDSECQNGTCIEAFPNYMCECLAGFEGEYCQAKIDHCLNVTCLNGTCVGNEHNASCVCDDGFYGDLCESIDLCYEQPCLNGANCSLSSASSFSCVCPANYSGSLCQTSLNSCAYVECSNNASCVDQHGAAVCICSTGYTGRLCESIIEYCQSDPCQHNGTCREVTRGYNCTCSSQYTGERCEIGLTSCPLSWCRYGSDLLCVNSSIPNNSCYCPDSGKIISCTEDEYGLCNDSFCKNDGVCGAFKNWTGCICPDNYTGSSCDLLTDPCLSNPCNNNYCLTINQSSYECLCNSPYTGRFCESMVIPCTNTDNCALNGTKLCIQNPTEETCICHPAFSGDSCANVLRCPADLCSPPSTCHVVNGSFACVTNSTPNGSTQLQHSKTAPSSLSPSLNSHSSTSPSGPTNPPSTSYHSPTSLHHSSTNNHTPTSTNQASATTNPPTPFSPCSPEPCLHGNCTSVGLGGYSCNCLPGFTGANCDAKIDFCSQVSCANGGTCQNGSDSAICRCLTNFAGPFCLFELTKPDYIFNQCTNKDCRHLFYNGHCDQLCAGEEDCLFDGLDCLENNTCPVSECASDFGNSVCNKECNYEECIFDGGDCFPDYLSDNRQFAHGKLLISVQSPKSIFSFHVHVLPFILYRISTILRTLVIADYVSEIEGAPPRARRQLLDEYEYSYVIRSRIDNSLCEDYCFRTAAKASEFLNEYLSKSSIDTDQFRVLQVTNAEDTTSQSPVWQIAVGVSVVSLVIVAFVVIGGAIIRKKRPRGIYFPRSILPSHNSSERVSLVGPRSADEPVPAVSKYFSSDNPAKRSKLDHSVTLQDAKLVIPPSCSPPPYEAFQHPQEYLPNSVFRPINKQLSHFAAPEPRSSIELDHLLVQPSPPTEIIPSLASINRRGAGGYTALSLAIVIGDPTVHNNLPFPALPDSSCAASRAYASYQQKITNGMLGVEELINLGADANVANDEGATPLHLAAKYKRSEVAASLIGAGALVNKQDKLGHAPLHTVVTSGARDVLHIMLANRCLNINIQCHKGRTALMLCVVHLNNEMLKDLLQAHANVNLLDIQGYSALHWAVSVNNVVALQALIPYMADIDCQDSKGQTALFLAAKEGCIDCVTLLLQKQANPHITDLLCQSPRIVAFNNLHTDIEHLLSQTMFTAGTSESFKHDSDSVCAIGKSKSKSSSSRGKNEQKKKKTPVKISTSKVYPTNLKSTYNSANIKQEISSPSSQLYTPPQHPLAADYPADPQDYQTLNQVPHHSHSHPFPTPPNLHNEAPKQVLIDSLVAETYYASNFPSPESSNTPSPTCSKFNSLKNDNVYPDHLLDVKPLTKGRTQDPTIHNWDEPDWS